MELSRRDYAALYGPTTGDRVRLADTNLLVRVEADDNRPGHEPVVGFGKAIRDGQLAGAGRPLQDAMDVVITNVLLLDPVLGVRKTCLGIREGRVAAIGRAGDPDRDAEISVPISSATGIVAAEGLIATPGAVDSHVHLIGPQLVRAALEGGTTTVVAMSYSGAFDVGINPRGNFDRLLDAWSAVPLNLVPMVRGSTDRGAFLDELLEMGGGAFKIHEDVGAYPEIVDAVLACAERQDVGVALHADGLGEAATLEETLAAIAGRSIHAYHVEGCGGGPTNLLEAVAEPNVLPSSTTPTVPLGVNVAAEHEEMIATVHRLHPALPNDARAARARIRPWTIAAESVLHDLGAISIMSSDSMGMGRMSEVARRTWQLAHVMREAAGESGEDANERVLRYLAKLTINPALVHGIAHDVGTLEVGKLADVVLWRPAFFGVVPQLVLKAGFPVWGARGSGYGSTRIGEPVVQGRLWGSLGRAPEQLATVYTSAAGEGRVRARRHGPVGVVQGTRGLGKADLVRNGATPRVDVDGERCEVRVDGTPVVLQPATDLPLNAAYTLA